MQRIFYYIFFLFILTMPVAILSQQPRYLHRWEIKKSSGEQSKRNFDIFNKENAFIFQSHQCFLYVELSNLNAIIPDFQVNENGGPIKAGQWSPSVASNGGGNHVITWVDKRNESNFNNDSDIYAQRYSNDGAVLGANFRVNDDQGGASQGSPFIAIDSNGDFVITWIDWRNDRYFGDIYAQRFSKYGIAVGKNFKVNDKDGSADEWSHPSISTDDNGDFVINWKNNTDWTNFVYSIYAQRFSSDGTRLGTNFKVNDDQGKIGQNSYPSISTDDNGNFVIVWTDERNGFSADIYAQRYMKDGSTLGTNFKINDEQTNSCSPSISVDNSGNFVIAWMDGRNGNYDIYAQRYSSGGIASGTNFKVNDDQGSAWQESPYISTDGKGNFVITWLDKRNGEHSFERDIYAQRYSSDGAALGANFKVNEDQRKAHRSYFSVSSDGIGNFVFTWTTYNQNENLIDIYAQRYSSDGTKLGINFIVNDDQGSARQQYPSIFTDGSSNFVITWEDERNESYPDIYAQRYSSDGLPLGGNFKVNDDQGTGFHLSPSISVDYGGNFVIIWSDARDGDCGIYAQRYNNDGTKLGVNFKIKEDQPNAQQVNPSISMDGGGNFVIVWEDYNRIEGYNDIYAQRYTSDGTPIGTNFKVNDDQGTTKHIFPYVSGDGTGNFVVTWQDERNGDPDIYAQRYSSDGDALDLNFRVNDDQGYIRQWNPSVSTDKLGYFVIVWRDGRNHNFDIYAQRFSSEGVALGENFKVNDDQGSEDQHIPSISLDSSGNFIITWSDNRTGASYIYAQRYLSEGAAVGSNFRISNTISEKGQGYPAVRLCNNRIYTTWIDARSEIDIWANVLDWENPTSIRNKKQYDLPSAFILSQNYPNPFNSGTEIRYALPNGTASYQVQLKVYDILGRLVKVLVDQKQAAGTYSISWDGTDLRGDYVASGVYFYTLLAGELITTRKMLLLQ